MAAATRLLCAALLASPAAAEWTGLLGLTFESDVPIERKAMYCPTGYITGLQVRHGRDSKADTDMYDFKLKCGGRWGPWSGLTFTGFKEEKTLECPLKMHMTGLEVKQGRKEMGDVDTYDFKIQCSGVWQEYMGLQFSGEKAQASKECPAGQMAWGWRAYRGFVKRGDRDFYEFDLNCKGAESAASAVRRSSNLRELGLSQVRGLARRRRCGARIRITHTHAAPACRKRTGRAGAEQKRVLCPAPPDAAGCVRRATQRHPPSPPLPHRHCLAATASPPLPHRRAAECLPLVREGRGRVARQPRPGRVRGRVRAAQLARGRDLSAAREPLARPRDA